MTVKEIKENFRVISADGKYHLYDKTEGSGKRVVYKYLCSATKKGTSFNVDGYQPTTKLKVFLNQVKRKVKSYTYDSEYYDPNLREGLFEFFITHDYLTSLGFKSDNYDSTSYKLADKNVYGFITSDIRISFNGLDPMNCGMYDELSDHISIKLWATSTSYVTSKARRHPKAIKKAIDNLLQPLLLSEGSNFIKKTEGMEEFSDIDMTLKEIDVLAGTLKSENYKKKLKEELIKMANKL